MGFMATRSTSGRPVVTQDTGFGHELPTEAGLHAFRTSEEAVAELRAVARGPGPDAAAARSIAERFFDAERLLSSMLEEIAVSRP